MALEQPGGGRPVEIRAFRGSRKTSVYRDHALGAAAFRRILDAAARGGLPLFASLDRRGPHELDKRDARRLANEATDLRAGSELLDLDGDLVAIGEVARWCARAGGASWLTVAGL